MDGSNSGTQSLRSTANRPSAATSLTPTTGIGTASGRTQGSPPAVHVQAKTRTSFFDIFLSEKQIERNQKHAEIMAALKTSKEVEKQLIAVNNKLDELIAVLTTATGGGTKSLLLAAADDAKIALSNYSDLITSLNSSNTGTALADVDIENFRQHQKIANEQHIALRTIFRKTSNISEDVNIKFKEAEAEYKKALSLHEKFVEKHPQVEVPKSSGQRNSQQNVDGSEINSDSDSDSEEA